MSRKLVWIEEADFAGWGCSVCSWIFTPSDAPGKSLDEMKRNFELGRDKQCRLHACIGRPRVKDAGVPD